MALLLPFNDQTCETILPEVLRVLAAGGVIAIPTETSYGLAVRPTEPQALRRLFEIKGRPSDKPILVLIGNHGQLRTNWWRGFRLPLPSSWSSCWPGPLTIVFSSRRRSAFIADSRDGNHRNSPVAPTISGDSCPRRGPLRDERKPII